MTRIASAMSFVVAFAGCAQLLGIGGGDPNLVNPGPAPEPRHDPEAFTINTTMSDADAAALASASGKERRLVSWVIHNANRPMIPLCETDPGGALYPLASAGSGTYGFCWASDTTGADDSVDPDSPIWVPQGITTSRDADGPQPYDGYEAVVIAWHRDTDASARISIAPARGFGDTSGDSYRHILLVAPKPGPDFTAVPCHTGGAAWYGHLLYVACGEGIKIFDWNHVYNADNTDAPNVCDNAVGKRVDPTNGTLYCASGYGYLMIQVGEITSSRGNVQFSSISLDRASTPHKLVVSEYSPAAGGKLVRFDLNADTRLPAGNAAADAYDMPFAQVQGATSRDDKFWFQSSGGVAENGAPVNTAYGKLWFWDSSKSYSAEYQSAYGPEALSFWPGDAGMPETDRLYTLTENAGHRAVIAVRRVDFE